MAKKQRHNWTPAEKASLIQGWQETKQKEPGATLHGYCARMGILPGMLRGWMHRAGVWESLRPSGRERNAGNTGKTTDEGGEASATPAGLARGAAATPDSDWVVRHGAALRESMGLESAEQEDAESDDATSQTTLLSRPEGPPLTKTGKRLGRPTDAERAERRAQEAHEREQARTGAGLSRVAFERHPARRSAEEEPTRQPELPFRAEPVQREALPQGAPTAPNEFYAKVTEQALKERDAFRTVLEVMLRENGGKFPGV